MNQKFLLSVIFFIQCVAASADSSVHLRDGEKLDSGMKVLKPGQLKLDYVISEDEPIVNDGVVAVLIDRPYAPDFPNYNIQSSIHLVRGTGIGGQPTASSQLIYSKYHSQGITNQNLRNRFHIRFGNNERTDEPLASRRRKFLFQHPSDRSYRTVLLIKYSRGTSEMISRIPFQIGFSQPQEKAIITIVDLKDGVSDPVAFSVTLLPE